MACGDKYKHLLVTEGGRTPEDPCYLDSPFCLIGEYDNWKHVADKIAGQVKNRIGMLGGKNAKLPTGLNERIGDYHTEYHKLTGHAWLNLLQPDFIIINEATANAREGTCVMDLLDQELVKTGLEPPDVPAPDELPDRPGLGTRILVGGVAVVGVVAVGAFAWWAITRPSESESEASP